MTGWLIVAGDFARNGGMDRANLELAKYLSGGEPVHLVTHRAEDELSANPNVTVHRVPRPFGKHLLGQPLLARAGRKWASRLTAQGFRVIVNGSNCRWPDTNWVHYVHAAVPGRPTSIVGRWKQDSVRRAERASLTEARIVICNSRRTATDAIERVGVKPERTRVVYLGTDVAQYPFIDPVERAAARRRLGWQDDRPWVVFLGALGDGRKGFDTLYTAWRELCRKPQWDANLAVVGTGAALPGWRSRAEGDDLSTRICFLGFRTDVPAILAGCDGMVHPARYEPYGMGVHEALCRGLPAIVSAAAGVSERYPADLADLILRDAEDAHELRDRLKHWRANLDSFTLRIRPLADELRSRTWADMAREMRDTILSA